MKPPFLSLEYRVDVINYGLCSCLEQLFSNRFKLVILVTGVIYEKICKNTSFRKMANSDLQYPKASDIWPITGKKRK